MGALEGRFGEQHAVVGDDADGVAVDPGEAGHQGGAVLGLELGEAAAVDQPGDHLAHVVRRARVHRHGSVQACRVHGGRFGRAERPGPGRARAEPGDDRPDDGERVGVVLGQVVRHARGAGVQVAAAQLLRGDHLAGRRLHQRRAAEEDRALVADDHRLVAHRRDVGAARRAGAQDGRDLRDARGGEPGLVVEDPAEVVPVGEDLVLHGQEGSAGVDQVDAGQPVLQRHLLGPEVLLHRHRVVRAALDGGVVGDDDDLASGDPPDARDDAGGGSRPVVHAVGGERGQLQEGRGRVEQGVHPVAGEQLAA